ncbi:RNA cytidine acetyltransferase 1 [Jatropha curcas]|uniref:RNA cytidine acetyltransferase 1 n=1 Tax=Jatropha curcas TaxID=180498 RepID=UPI001893EC97|nr:RNA cytidine acetyltransferase 1 [Jatropha curcas]
MAEPDVAVPILVPDQPCLYEVDISKLFIDENLNRSLCLSLAKISNNMLKEGQLRSISTDPRQCLYVLTDPIQSWVRLDDPTHPTLYCAVQVYLEGPIPDSIQENENVGESIAQTFAYFPRLKSKNLVGAQIVHLFAAEDGYGSSSLDMLTRFYGGTAATNSIELDPLISPRKKWIKLHYLGAYIDLTVNAVTRWEGYSFFLLFVMNLKGEIYSPVMFKPLNDYELEISGNDENCSVPNLAENSRIIFVRQLSLHLRTLDHEVALRLLESFSRMIHAKKLPRVNKLWQGRDRERVDDFIRFPGKLEKLELVTDLMCDLASSYFTGKLPIELNCRMMNKSVCSLCCKIRLTYFRMIMQGPG